MGATGCAGKGKGEGSMTSDSDLIRRTLEGDTDAFGHGVE